MSKKMIETNFSQKIFTISLNRPEKANCYDFQMAKMLEDAFRQASQSSAHLIIIEAKGANFCTGADLDWLKKGSEDMSAIKEMYQALLSIEQPIVAMVQGKVRGGGVGLVAGCDIVIAEADASFCLSEASLGMIPGIITPLVVKKIGISAFSELSLTSRVINFNEALTLGLIHHASDQRELIIKLLLSNEIDSLKMIKKIIKEKLFSMDDLEQLAELSQQMRLNSTRLKSR